ncbi:MAG TPA: SUMF1/EgtB/PvdO family nonheme iron enzyme [Pyrinomonadaceae bacterium]
MSNIFISYAREDKESARRLARALEAQEWNVFWDPKIPAGKTWRGVIGEKLNLAQCLVVLWSKSSITSDWVIEEAETGRRRNILIPVFIEEDVEPPLGFRNLQAADLSKWDGSETDDVFQSLVIDIKDTLGPAAAEEANRLREVQVKEERKQRELQAALVAAAEEEKARQLAGQKEAERLLDDEKRARAAANRSQDLPQGPVTLGVFPWKNLILIVGSALVVIMVVIMAGYQLLVVKRAGTGSSTEEQGQKNQNTDKGRQEVAGGESIRTPPAEMAYVPGGEFTMGRDAKDGGDEYERPAHKVVVNSFFIDLFEVTSENYKKCVDDGKCQSPPGWVHSTYATGADRLPVTGVTWDQANAYANWAGKRLPMEAEWEYAARGGDGRRYPWGNEWKPGLANANGASTAIVGVGLYKGTSPFGAFDIVGNVWEWTASDLAAYTGGKLPAQPPAGSKVVRGGNYKSDKYHGATTTYRLGLLPVGDSSKYISTGFRCVKDISSSTSTTAKY